MSPRHLVATRFFAVALLLVFGWLQFSTLSIITPTVDEPLHIVRGYAYITRGDERIRLRGPILSNALNGLALLLEPNLKLLPPDDPAWLDSEAAGLAEHFMWYNAVPTQRIVFLARLPILFVSLVLGAFIFRWASERSGAKPALGALLLYVFCPNMLAHARLATTDVVTAATILISVYAFQRALDAPRRAPRLLSGVALGLALAAKFSSAVLPVAFVVYAAIRAWQERRERRAWVAPVITVLASLGIGAVTLWAVYGFKIAPIEPGGIPLPAPYYWAEWQALDKYVRSDRLLPSYLFGRISNGGWWYYFPVVFLVKTPLPVLVMLLLGLALTIRARTWRRDFLLWLVPGLVMAILLFSPQDIGYRYLLPLLPFIFVAGADVIAAALRFRWAQVGMAALLVWQVWGTLNIYPYYLAYFNELAGGPDRGRYILSDSNIDWGQDLIGLKHYLDERHITDLKLSYFGGMPPSVYGMRVEALPPVRHAMYDQGAWWLYKYYPPDPAPGVYAISVVNLMGGIWIDQQTYAYFRDRVPDATVGHSIYIYTIPLRGAPTDLALSGLQITQIDPLTYTRFGTNAVRPRWFDAATSLIAAPGEAWIALADDRPLAPEFASLFEGVAPEVRAQLTDEDRRYNLYHFDLGARLLDTAARSEQAANGVALPIQFSEAVELIGYRMAQTTQGLTLITYWRAGEPIVTPLQLFVHAIGPDGSIVAQDDRLDASPYGWRSGDMIAQINRLTLPAEPLSLSIEIGLYNLDTGERLPVIVDGREADRRLLLKQVEFEK